LLLLFLLLPILEVFVQIKVLLSISISIVLISGIYAVSENRTLFIVGLALALGAFITRWGTYIVSNTTLFVLHDSLSLMFVGFAAVVILIHIFKEDEVTGDIISGAICVYLLMGILWAFVFSIMESTKPGSFLLTSETEPSQLFQPFFYYSFVTQTTLGYGDITPVSNLARSLALLEAIVGQLFIAVMIARLVGIHIAQSIEKRKSS